MSTVKKLQGKRSKTPKTVAEKARDAKIEEIDPGFAKKKANPPVPPGLKKSDINPPTKMAPAKKATTTKKVAHR